MRKRILVVMAATIFCLTGCASVPSLTEQQNDAIAEYVADSLLEKDKNYSSTMKFNDDIDYATPEPSVQPTSVPVASATPLLNDNPVDTSGYSDKKLNEQNGEEPDNEKRYVSLSKAMQISGFKVKVNGYKYSKEISTKVSNISSNSGKKLFVLRLKLKNSTESKKKLDMTKNKSKYSLSINGKQMEAPLLTIAKEDIHFIKKSVPSQKAIKAIIVFEIPENTKMKDIVLEVANNDEVAQVNIK